MRIWVSTTNENDDNDDHEKTKMISSTMDQTNSIDGKTSVCVCVEEKRDNNSRISYLRRLGLRLRRVRLRDDTGG